MSLVEKYTASSFLTQQLVHSTAHSRHFGHTLSESSVHHYPRQPPLYRAKYNSTDEENVSLKLCAYNFEHGCYKLIAIRKRPECNKYQRD